MATALDWTFVVDGDPERALRTLTDVIEADAAWGGPWTELRAEDDPSGALTSGRRSGWTLWRLLGQREIREPVAITVGIEPARPALRWRLADVGPLCAITGPDGAPKDHPHHERVLENAERCTRVALDAACRIGARSAAAFSDAGAPLPWNAHVLYWSDEERAAHEIASALEAAGGPLDAHRGHTWRSEEQRRELEERLAAPETPIAVSGEHVRSVLDGGHFDVYRTDAGFAVLEYPWYVNAFVDRFLLEVADVAQCASD